MSDEGGKLDSLDFFIKGKQASSSKEALSLLRIAADDPEFILRDYAQFEMGELCYKAGNYAAAIPEYRKLAARYPKSLLITQASLMLGKSYFNGQDFPRARETFQSLVNQYPDAKEAAESRYLIARAYEKQGKWKEAYLAYEETDLYHPLGFFGKKSRIAMNSIKKSHKKELPRSKPTEKALFQKGLAYFEDNDFEMAANIFSRLAREFPKSKYIGEAWLMLGRAQMQTNNASTISDFSRAAAANPSLAGKAHYYKGLTYGRRGDWDSAIAELKKVNDPSLADEAAYWAAYYKELSGESGGALQDYYALITKFPYSSSVAPAIWRMGKIYYWKGDFKNAATYLHMAQLYPPGEDSPRCYYFEAKALERLGNRPAAMEVYEKLARRFDHTYYGYRALEKIKGNGFSWSAQNPFSEEDFSEALKELKGKNPDELAALMEVWEEAKGDALEHPASEEARAHLAKYKTLLSLGLTKYAADEAHYLVNITSDSVKDPLQTRLGEMLVHSGNYKTPLRFADRKIKNAILADKASTVPKKIWQLSYPRAYWPMVSKKAGQFGVDPYLVLAVMREESRFNPKATSRSGARGLMQIMPRTGKGIAKDLDISRFKTRKLYEPSLNISMGAYYLSHVLKNFSGNTYLTLAGYNGGPNKIRRYVESWYNGDLGQVDVDEFVESIPNRETRLYVQKVMGSYFEYKRLYD